VATILGLLLVVTMLANYLSTQLPSQMQVNDANHTLAVENQVARLDATLRDVAGAGSVGGVLSQPVSLGSAGAPPFAAPDGASIAPGMVGSGLTVAFTVLGTATYLPPGGWPAGGNLNRTGCSESPPGSNNPTSVSCTGGTVLTQNFTNGSHFISVTGGSDLHLNFTTSYSTVVVGAAGGAGNTVGMVGSYDTVYLNATGGSTVHVILVGNYDTLAVAGKGGATVVVYLVGNHDSVSWSANGASSHFLESAWGSYDNTTDSNSNAAVYYTGFDTGNPSSDVCPYGNDSSTDGVSGSGGTVTYNNTGYSGSGSSSGWTSTWSKVTGLTCPFFAAVQLPQKSSGAVGASLVVHLRNTYTPAADIAFDQGAVVYAQANGPPLILVGPGFNYSSGTLSLWVPEFQGSVGTEAGAGIAEVSVRLVSLLTLALPAGGFSLKAGSDLYVNVTSVYAAGWTTYLSSYLSTTALKGVATVTCQPASSAACKGPFAFNGPLGTVSLAVPASALSALDLQVATYSVSLT
jgi:hypothetical protein